MALTTEQQMLVEQRLSNDKKSVLVAYLLWFFLGWLGGHRFYLERKKSAIWMIALTVIGWITTMILIGFPILIGLGIWLLVDAFRMPGMINELTQQTRTRLAAEIAGAAA